MENKKILPGIFAAALAFGLSYCSAMCFATAYGGYADFDRDLLLWLCLLTGAVCAAAFSFRHGGWAVLGLLALAAGYALGSKNFILQAEALVNALSRVGQDAYGWPALSWSGADLTKISSTLGLAPFCILSALCAAWVLVRQKWSIFALIPALIPFGICFIATDLVPDTPYIFGLLLCTALLLFTQSIRIRSVTDGAKLTAIVLLPLFLLSVLLFAALPKAKYEQQISDLQQQVLSWFNGLPFVTAEPDGSLGIGTNPEHSLDLSAVGTKTQLRYAVLEVLSDRTDHLYLRGQSLEVYTGTTWLVSDSTGDPDVYWPRTGLEPAGQVQIELRSTRSVLYFPYYAQGKPWTNSFPNGSLYNPDNLLSYTMERYVPAEGGAKADFKGLDSAIYDACLTLPTDTYDWAQTLVAELGITRTASAAEKAQIIGEYVSQSAQYSLKTPKMPEDETDFARWFLTESETGYCIHFATAATVLLRAAGVPARYVSGYAADVAGGIRTTVTADKAHAWVEYIDPVAGWTVLDPTPAQEPAPTESTEAPTEQPTEPSSETPTEGTAAPSTEAPTVPSSSNVTVPSTAPSTEPSADVPQKEMPSWVRSMLLWLAGALGVCAAGLIQYDLRRKHRKKVWSSGPENTRALQKWRYILLLRRLLKANIPRELTALAEKARFSQHCLTESELHSFDAQIRQYHSRLAQCSPLKRLLWKLIFAVG